ncbi:hypothetical protein RI570_21605 [Brucella pseudogrignonensis]|uniref:DUF6950 family protein n=1 Tax=Brucella pseudogrignonensis TaxID=419475 RepID=UPI0028B8F4DF|nr:hypothetical protein [Brucella pseudogrignonensis]MDT6938558.1 hypothetical protein [Brucella pseudogrignonensis]MDT6941954.1 hypothetical protein [Brucella pseudogrignonensis]MDT6942579.1 hypothetical protein [Brucella pseudogrignonensis]MDT6942621.1 hypothetical protein [Brucella pseudogrignonensis]MDT6942649.1 hypothetical protein [Brucella pseudogrignonensis]
MHIDEFVAAEARKPFRWGETDCVSTADRWVRNRTGLSPLAWMGRQYRDEAEASAILSVRGCFPILVNRAMRSQGFEKTASPVCGDVGLIIHNQKLCVAIHAETIWFSHDETGLIGAPLDAIWKAWRIQCQ